MDVFATTSSTWRGTVLLSNKNPLTEHCVHCAHHAPDRRLSGAAVSASLTVGSSREPRVLVVAVDPSQDRRTSTRPAAAGNAGGCPAAAGNAGNFPCCPCCTAWSLEASSAALGSRMVGCTSSRLDVGWLVNVMPPVGGCGLECAVEGSWPRRLVVEAEAVLGVPGSGGRGGPRGVACTEPDADPGADPGTAGLSHICAHHISKLCFQKTLQKPSRKILKQNNNMEKEKVMRDKQTATCFTPPRKGPWQCVSISAHLVLRGHWHQAQVAAPCLPLAPKCGRSAPRLGAWRVCRPASRQ